MRGFWNKCFQHKVKNSDFRKNVKKYLTLTMRCDQTTRPIRKQKASLERWYPYLSCFTLGFEIYAHQLGHNGSGKIMVPCGQRQKVSDMSIVHILWLVYNFFTKRLQKKIELVGRPAGDRRRRWKPLCLGSLALDGWALGAREPKPGVPSFSPPLLLLHWWLLSAPVESVPERWPQNSAPASSFWRPTWKVAHHPRH